MTSVPIFESPEFGTFEVAIIDDKEHIEATPCVKTLGYATHTRRLPTIVGT